MKLPSKPPLVSNNANFTIPDIFGKEINLLYEEKAYFPTTCGRCSTVLVIIILVAALVSESVKFIRQDLATLSSYETTRAAVVSPTITLPYINTLIDHLQNDKIFMAVGFRPQSLLEPSDISIMLAGEQDVQIECEKSNYNEELYIRDGVEWSCLHLKSQPLMTSIGRVYIDYCIKGTSTEKQACLSRIEALSEQERSIEIEVALEVNVNQVNSRNQEPVAGLRIFRTAGVPNLVKRHNFRLIEYESVTYTGYGTSQGYNSLLFKDHYETVVAVGGSETRRLLEIEIEIDQNRKMISERKLYPLKDVISFLGGLFKGLSIFFFAIVWPFREVSYYRSLINQVFRLCDSPETMKRMATHDPIFKSSPKIKLGSKRTGIFITSKTGTLKDLQKNESNEHMRTEEGEDIEIRQLVDCIEDVKHRFKLGGLFQRLIHEDKQEIVKQIEQDLLKKKDSISSDLYVLDALAQLIPPKKPKLNSGTFYG